MQFLDKHGWPVERIRGRRIKNLIRLLIHTRKIRRGAWRPTATAILSEVRATEIRWHSSSALPSRTIIVSEDLRGHLEEAFGAARDDLGPREAEEGELPAGVTLESIVKVRQMMDDADIKDRGPGEVFMTDKMRQRLEKP